MCVNPGLHTIKKVGGPVKERYLVAAPQQVLGSIGITQAQPV